MHTQLHESYHHGVPCLPGIYRLFARTDGALFPCERVNEELPYYKIGTVDEGFDLERMRDILNIGKITEEECKTCWNLQQCMMCSSEIEAKDHMRPSREEKLAVCQRKEAESLFSLHEQCILKEFGYELDKEVM